MNETEEKLDKTSEEDKKSQLISVRREVLYSAPLPEASQFERYEKVLLGAADRIIKMAERQSQHRQCLEKWSVIGNQFLSFVGLIFGLIVALAGIGGGIYLLYHNKTIEGLGALVLVLAGLVTSFIFSKKEKSEDLKEREKELNE